MSPKMMVTAKTSLILSVYLIYGAFSFGVQLSQFHQPSIQITLNAIPEIYNVKIDCNAKGDGSTDDTIAIQNCSNLLSSTGGVLYFPTGIYLISSTITFGNFVKFPIYDHLIT